MLYINKENQIYSGDCLDNDRQLSEEEQALYLRGYGYEIINGTIQDISQTDEYIAEQEEKEMAILAAYLPAEMSDEDLMKIIKGAISEGGFSSKADLGKATGAVMKLVGGAASGDRVREMLAGELE